MTPNRQLSQMQLSRNSLAFPPASTMPVPTGPDTGRADDALLVPTLGARLEAGAVPVEAVEVLVVRVDAVAREPGVALRHAGVVREQAVEADADGVVVEVVVVHPEGVAGRPREAGEVVVRPAAGDLDGVAGAVLR